VIGDSVVMSGHFQDNSAYSATRLAMLQDPARRIADAEAVARALEVSKEEQRKAAAAVAAGANGKNGGKGGAGTSGLASGSRVDWKFQWNSKNSFTPQGSRPNSGGDENGRGLGDRDMLGTSSSPTAGGAAADGAMDKEANNSSGVEGSNNSSSSSNSVNQGPNGGADQGDFAIEEQRKLDFDRTSYAVYNDNDDDNSFGSLFGPPTIPWKDEEEGGEDVGDALTVSDSLGDDGSRAGGDVSLHSWTAGDDLLTEAGLALHDQLFSNSSNSIAIGSGVGDRLGLPFAPPSYPYSTINDALGGAEQLREDDLQEGTSHTPSSATGVAALEVGAGEAAGVAALEPVEGDVEVPRGRTQSQYTGRRRRMVSPGGITGEAQALRPSEHAIVNVEGIPLLCTMVPEEFRDDESVSAKEKSRIAVCTE